MNNAEKILAGAPSILLKNGESCVPQHFLTYSHTRQSVEQLVLQIDYDLHYPIFVCEDGSGIYIQIGIIGYDNYSPKKSQSGKKVIYGRKWRVEKELPTSEIIQTVFLAIKSAREHEVRELFQLKLNGRVTTPFSNHHDLPLMADHSDLVNAPNKKNTKELSLKSANRLLEQLRYDAATLLLDRIHPIAKDLKLIEIKIIPSTESQLPEIFTGIQLRLVVEKLTENKLLFQLMRELIDLSNRHVEEHFTFRRFHRFSEKNQVKLIAELSSNIRKNELSQMFLSTFERSNYLTDKTRVPKLVDGQLSKKIKKNLSKFGSLDGFLPEN